MEKTIQIYYGLTIKTGEDMEDISIDEQKKILPEFLAWYSPTWFARNFPQNEEDLPAGVKASKHFVSFDMEKGLSLCVEYNIDEDIVNDTDKFKKTLSAIVDDAEGQFSDGWGESFEQHSFEVNGQEYCPQANSDIIGIVTNVDLHESLLVKWKSIDEIEHTYWMLSYDNDIVNILYHEEQHNKNVEREKKMAKLTSYTEKLDMYEFVKSHKEHFFIAS